ncbi:MAG TPA: NYN domain-containing protein [Vicinamibacteria bacterium]|nr:NYN domain-containing protein [Vicinamibacteria bacterium]
MPEEPKLALFIDLENLALGAVQAKLDDFDIQKVLERLVEKGKIIVKKAYADWTSYKKFKQRLHESGIELIDIPQRRYSGKNSADIKMVVDAIDLCYSKEHINYFVLASGDSDFAPLVAKLKENDKTVIGVGLRQSTSELLSGSCDEFIFYDDLVQKAPSGTQVLANVPKKKQKAFEMVLDAIDALKREDKDVIWSSMVKQTIKRKQPSFSETTYGYSNFSELLVDGARLGLFEIKKDDKSGSYVISDASKKS